AAVAGDQLTRVLDLHPTLDRRLREIAESGSNREDHREQRDLPCVDAQAEEVVEQHDGRDAARPTTEETFDRLAGADRGREFVAPDRASREVGGRVDGER